MVERELLEVAAHQLGLRITDGPTNVADYGGRTQSVDFKLDSRPYALGFVRTASGFEAVGDLMGGTAETLQRLQQQYARAATLRQLEEQGFAVVEETAADGTIRLTLERLVYA